MLCDTLFLSSTENSIRGIECDYFDTLADSLCECKGLDRVCICGNVNGKIGKHDYDVNLDVVLNRDIVDKTVNTYGQFIVEFLYE